MHRISWRRLIAWLGCLTLVVVAAGCSGKKGTISGKVYYKDELLRAGNVTFTNPAGTMSVAIQEDGSYTISNMPIGEAKIGVETDSVRPRGTAHTYAPPKDQTVPGGYDPSKRVDRSKYFKEIPNFLGDPQQSNLSYTVQSGTQAYDIRIP